MHSEHIYVTFLSNPAHSEPSKNAEKYTRINKSISSAFQAFQKHSNLPTQHYQPLPSIPNLPRNAMYFSQLGTLNVILSITESAFCEKMCICSRICSLRMCLNVLKMCAQNVFKMCAKFAQKCAPDIYF